MTLNGRNGSEARARRPRRRVALTSGLAIVTAIAVAAPVSARDCDDLKTYTVDLDGGSLSLDATGPGLDAGDVDGTLSLTVRNTSAHQTLGSVNVTLPAPLTLVAAAADAVAGGPVVELRSLELAPGAATTVALTVQVGTCTPASTTTAFAAKQSNDFNGTGNDFTLDAAGSDTVVEVLGSCRLAFVGQPRGAERSAVITSEAWAPAGAPVSVEVLDAAGGGRVTWSTAPVALTLASSPAPSATLGGTIASAAVAGLATFSPGPTISTSAFGYRLAATSPGLVSSPPSDAFDVVDDQTVCGAGATCSSSLSAAGQTVTVALGTGAAMGSLLTSVGAADTPSFECADYPRNGQPVSQYTYTGTGTRSATISITYANATRPAKSYNVCWAAPYPFLTKSGATATEQGTKPGTGEALYVGTLPDCSRRNPVAPCVRTRSCVSRSGSITLTVLATSDDPWRY